jgi:DNA-binding NarL/FixJ family response regulator
VEFASWSFIPQALPEVEELNLCARGVHDKPESEVTSLANVLAMVDDLFFQAKIVETARHLAVDLRICTTPDALLAEISRETPKLVVVDLNSRNQPLQAIERMQATAPGVPLVGFLSHVQTELAEQAQAAGCREVMPRSKFTKDLATILARGKSESK